MLESKEIETYLSRSLLTEGSWLWMGREADVEKEVERNKLLTRRIRDNNINLLHLLLVLDFLDISSDFTFLRGVERLEGLEIEQNKIRKELKEDTEVFLVAEEVYNLGPGRARVQRYAAWDGGGNLIEEVGDIITM